MNTRSDTVSRRRGIVTVGILAVVLAGGGAAAVLATGDDGGKGTGTTVTQVSGSPTQVSPPQPQEVPGATPRGVKPGRATLLPDAPVVTGQDGDTTTIP
ncbi:hypothetical protein ACIQVK_50735 [Streptomyces sp. NPDC090493]|uniref:hypothetical protein n=1 Tax=Streptomyces sp. NPDC090493 TaxID=3365964 RepID=UPI00382AFA59